MTSNRSAMRGIGLIEVLVAMFILAIGVLGAAAMQMNALKFNQNAAQRSQATFLAYEIADSMRANRAAALAGNYDLALSAATPTGTTIPQTDLGRWRAALAQRLPAGNGSIVRNGAVFTITIQWDESRLGNIDDAATDDADESIGQFTFVTEL